MQTRKIRWNRLALVVAGAFGLLLICCVAIWALAPNLRRILQAPYWKTDVQLAAQAARQMIDYDLPANYQAQKILMIENHDAAVDDCNNSVAARMNCKCCFAVLQTLQRLFVELSP